MFGVEKKMDIESLVPDEAKNWNTKKKAQWLEQQVVPIVNAIFRPYSAPRDVKVYLKRSGVLYCVTVPPDDIGKTLELKINGEIVKVTVPSESPPDNTDDRLYTYSLSLLRAALDFILFNDIIKSGDIEMTTIMIKRFIPLFVGLSSYRSKYAIECINFLTKTECMLSEFDSVRVKLGLFVNKKGKPGKNKAADMQQENNIKLVKHVIRGLGAGKSDKAMLRVSKAAPVISELVTELEGNLSKKQKDRHSKKSMTEDIALLGDRIRTLRPFKIQEGRPMNRFEKVHSNIIGGVSKEKLKEFIIRHSCRAVNKLDLDDSQDQ